MSKLKNTLIAFIGAAMLTSTAYAMPEKHKAEQTQKVRVIQELKASIKKDLDKKQIIKEPEIDKKISIYSPEEADFYLKHKQGKELEAAVGARLNKRRQLERITASGSLGPLAVDAMFNPLKNTSSYRIRGELDKTGLELMLGTNQLKTRLITQIPCLDVLAQMYYDVNNQVFNYSLKKNFKGLNMMLFQNYQPGRRVTRANIGYSPKTIIDNLGMSLLINNRQYQAGLKADKKLGIITLQASLDYNNGVYVPGIQATLSYKK